MKIAINHYGRFECVQLELFLNRDDTFIVTPKIEKSRQFQTGLDRKKFQFIDVTDLAVVERAVNITPTMLEKFRTLLTTDPEPETPPAEPETPPAGEHPPEEEGEKTEEPPKEEEAPKEDENVDEGAGEEEQDPVLPFTEEVGNVDKATAAVEKETDIEKLKFALEHDSRVTVKAAIEARLQELES